MTHTQTRIVLERKARAELNRLLADGNTPQKIAKRVRIILMNADGHGRGCEDHGLALAEIFR
jgi:hypothetical protein